MAPRESLGGWRRSAVEENLDASHIQDMAAKSAKLPASPSAGARRDGWYRGVKLQPPPTPPKTPLAQLEAAVDRAFAKNADALAGRK